jgi:hypothetical protein
MAAALPAALKESDKAYCESSRGTTYGASGFCDEGNRAD